MCRVSWEVSVWEGVIEIVEVLPVFDFDGEGSGDALELAGAGAGNDDDLQGVAARVHGGQLGEREGAGFSVEGSGEVFDGDVAGGAEFVVAGADHFPFAGAAEVALKLLVHGEDGESFSRCGGFRLHFDGEGALGVMGHGLAPLLSDERDGETEE